MTRDDILIALMAAGLQAGVQQTAMSDFLRYGGERFALDEAAPEDIQSWVTSMQTDKAHLFSTPPARQRSPSPILPMHEGLSATEKLARYRPQGVKRERPQPVALSSEQQATLAKLSATQRLSAYRKMQAEQV